MCVALSVGRISQEFGLQPYKIRGTDAGLRSTMIVPLIAGNRAVGALWFHSKDSDAYSTHQKDLGMRVGRLIAGSIANARIYATMVSEVRRRTVLDRVGRVSDKATTIAELVEGWADHLAPMLPMDRIHLALVDIDRKITIATYDYRVAENRIADREQIEVTRHNEIVKTDAPGGSVATSPHEGRSQEPRRLAQQHGRSEDRFSLSVDLLTPGTSTGRITFYRDDGRPYDEEQADLVERATPLLSSGIRRIVLANRISFLEELRVTNTGSQFSNSHMWPVTDICQLFTSESQRICDAECVAIVGIGGTSRKPQIAVHSCSLDAPDCAALDIASSAFEDSSKTKFLQSDAAHVVEIPGLSESGNKHTVGMTIPVRYEGMIHGVITVRRQVSDPTMWAGAEIMSDISGALTTLWKASERVTRLIADPFKTQVPVRAALIHEHESCRVSLKALLETSRVQIVEEGTEEEAIPLVERCEPSVVIYRIHESDPITFQWLADLGAMESPVPVLVIGDSSDERNVRKLAQAGVEGFIAAGVHPDVMAGAVEQVARGGGSVDRGLLKRLVDGSIQVNKNLIEQDHARFDGLGLSDRDLEILKGIAQGESNQEIAIRFNLATGTIKNRIVRIYRLLGVSRRAEAAFLAGRMLSSQGEEPTS